MQYDRIRFELINLGGTRTISVIESIRTLQVILGVGTTIQFLDSYSEDPPLCQPDLSKARMLLDYRPQTEFRDGVRSFATWFRSNQHLVLASSDNPDRVSSDVASQVPNSRVYPN